MTEADWLTSTDPQKMLAWVAPDCDCAVRQSVGSPVRQGLPHLPGCRHVSDRKLRLWVETCRAVVEQQGHVKHKWMDLETDAVLPVCLIAWSRDGYPGEALPIALRANLLRDIVGNPFRPVSLRWEEGDLYEYAGSAQHGFRPPTPYYEPVRWLTPLVRQLIQAAYEERIVKPCPYCKDAIFDTGDFGDPLMGGKEPFRSRAAAYLRSKCACHGTGTIETGHLDPDRLLILADALEEAGCDNEDILRHLRGEDYTLCPMNAAHAVTYGWDGEILKEGPQRVQLWRKMAGLHVRGCWALDLLLGQE